MEITPKHIAELSNAMAENKITSKQGKDVFAEMMETAKLPSKIIEEKGMVVVSDTGAIENFVKEVIAENPKAIADYKNGKTNVVGWLMGQVMKKSGGKLFRLYLYAEKMQMIFVYGESVKALFFYFA